MPKKSVQRPRQSAAQKSTDEINEWGGSHALKPAHLRRMNLRRLSRGEATALLGFSAPAGGFLLPYFTLDAEPTDFFRIRFDNYHDSWAKTMGRKPLRYAQPPETGVAAYFAPLVNWREIAADPGVALLVTEGEAKGAAACAHGLPCIAFGGVGSWHGTKAGLAMLPDLQPFTWKERTVSIAYDSDATQKPDVLLQENQLASALVNEGARVKVVRLPALPDGKKCGLDDYLLAHGGDALRALIDETQEWALSRELYELSARYGYVHDIARVVEYPTPERPSVRLFAPETFWRSTEIRRRVLVDEKTGALATAETEKPRSVSAAKYWHDNVRPTFDSMTYVPGAPPVTSDNKLNSWRPSGIEPREGDTAPWNQLLEHLIPDPEARRVFEQTLAAPLQQPGLRLNFADVLWGEVHGTGKTMVGETIGALHGASNYDEITQAELLSQFNDWQANKTFVMGSELCGEKDSRGVADRLKTIITGNEVLINQKHQPRYRLPNHVNLFLTSNHQNAVYIDDNARRFFVLHTKAGCLPSAFYKSFVEWRNNGGLGALYHRMLKMDLSGFDAKGHAPRTQDREEMVEANRTQVQQWVHELRINTDTALTPVGSRVTVPGSFFTTRELLNIFSGGKPGRLTDTGMANALRAAGFKKTQQIRIPGTSLTLRLWIIRDALKAENMTAPQIGAAYARQLEPMKEAGVAGLRRL